MDNLHPVKRVQAGQPMQVLLAASLLVSALLTNVVRVPTIAGYVSTSLLVATVALVWVRTSPNLVPRDKTTIRILGVLSGLFIAGLLTNGVTVSRFAETTVFISASAILVLITPRLIDRETFETVVSWFAVALVAIAGIVQLIGVYPTLLGVRPEWYVPTALPGLPIKILPWVGVLNSSNLLGAICVIGAFAATINYYRTRSRQPKALAVVLGIGALLTTSRAAILALVAGVGVLATYHFKGRDGLYMTILLGVVGALVGTTLILLPSVGDSVLQYIDLSGRKYLWQASWDAIARKPVFGWGATETADIIAPYVDSAGRVGRTPHNSYLRVGVMTGFIGLTAYIALSLLGLVRSTVAVSGYQSAAFVALFVAVLVFQMFNVATIYGLSIRSVLYALVTGYSLTSVR